MADFLRFKGAKSVTKQTGDEMRLRRPPNGGDTWQTKRWWGGKGKVVYITAAIFNVETSGDAVQLVIPTDNETTAVSIRHDGNGNFTFSDYRGVDRIAVYNADRSALLTEYQFPAISGGSVLKRILIAPEPPVSFTGTTSISGTTTVGQTLTATASTFTGGKGAVTTNLIFQVSDDGISGWTTLADNQGVASGGTATYTLTGAESGKYIRASYQVTDDDATHISNSTQTGPIAATFATRVANADLSYTVTVVNTAAEGEPEVNVYALNGTNQQAVALNVGESVAFDFSAVASAHPLGIFTSADKTTPVTVGVETGGAGNATLLFTPPIAGTFSYQCINHANMGGDITVS